jgi:hypothetical protein
MAGVLRRGGHSVEVQRVPEESHDSLKPSLVSRAFGWLERSWGGEYDADAAAATVPLPAAGAAASADAAVTNDRTNNPTPVV